MEIQCLLCLDLNTDLVNCVDIYSDEWREQNIESLIEKHLWPMNVSKRSHNRNSRFGSSVYRSNLHQAMEAFDGEFRMWIQLISNMKSSLKSQSRWLCSRCWTALHEFQQFYRLVEDANFLIEYLVKTEETIHIEECELTDFLQDNQAETSTVCDTVITSDSNDNDIFSIHETQNYVQENFFKCQYCLKDLKEEQALVDHIAWHEGYMNHKLPFENSNFGASKYDDQKSSNLFYKQSQKISSNSVFGESTEYIAQERESDDSKILKCKYCHKILKDQRLLSKHLEWHKGNVYICEICDLQFLVESKLEHHKLIHTSRGGISPNHDDKTDNIPTVAMNRTVVSSLENVSNSNKGTIECKYCSKILEDQRALSYHIAWHKGSAYCCEICDLKFFDLNKFKSHNLAHNRRRTQRSNEKISTLPTVSQELEIEEIETVSRASTACDDVEIFHCDICDLKFADAAQLYKHKSTHSSQTNRSCDTNGETEGALIEENQEEVNHIHQAQEEDEGEDENNTTSSISINLNSNLNMEQAKCEFCSKDLEDGRVLLNHKAWHEGDIFHCNACELKFFDKSKFEDHELAHTLETPESDGDDSIPLEYFVCSHCSKVINNRRLFLNHNAWHIGNVHQCDICDLKFLDKFKYDSHVETHLMGPMLACPDCGKTYEVKRHRDKMHRNMDVQICDFCGKIYRCPISFGRHINKHKGNTAPKLPCDICGRLLKGNNCLKSHKLIMHPKSGVLPYVCDICLKPAASRSILNRHIVVYHKTLGNYKCPVCDKNFKKAIDLKHHSVIHSAEPKFTCDWCPQKFYSNSSMSRHKKKTHPKEHEEWKKKLYVQL